MFRNKKEILNVILIVLIVLIVFMLGESSCGFDGE